MVKRSAGSFRPTWMTFSRTHIILRRNKTTICVSSINFSFLIAKICRYINTLMFISLRWPKASDIEQNQKTCTRFSLPIVCLVTHTHAHTHSKITVDVFLRKRLCRICELKNRWTRHPCALFFTQNKITSNYLLNARIEHAWPRNKGIAVKWSWSAAAAALTYKTHTFTYINVGKCEPTNSEFRILEHRVINVKLTSAQSNTRTSTHIHTFVL